MKTALVTLSIGKEFKEILKLTKQSMIDYSSRTFSDFICIDTNVYGKSLNNKFEKLQILHLLNNYDRIIYVDADVIIMPDCPNLFDLVPESHIGAFIVSRHSDFHNFSNHFLQEKISKIDNWRREERNTDIYESFNSGVLVISNIHTNYFTKNFDIAKKFCGLKIPNIKNQWINTGDQFFFNYITQKENISIHDIGYQFNHTCATNFKTNRFKSYIIHYAGNSHRLKKTPKIDKIKIDSEIISNQTLLNSIRDNDIILDFVDTLW
jgi:lipopolysaccharide biosynthesis glycosyltransferase